jgi:hypothetical protein
VSLAEYSARIEAARRDEIELGQIADELQLLQGSDFFRLRMRAIMMRKALRQTAQEQLSSAPAGEGHVPRWLGDLGLVAIDGRPLYRYRLSEQAFQRLQADLRTRSTALRIAPDKILSARFVLWAAEWFRRSYDGTGQRWEAVGQPLGIHANWSEWRKLTDIGLRHWRIPELRINGTHHRLAAIARQGGFPLAAVDGQGAGWAPRFLERLVSQLLGEPEATLDAADAIALTLMEMVPETWRNPEIRIVSAELAVDIVRLRRLAEADGVPDGALVSVWLDQHHEGWRDELPLSVSTDAGRALIDGLMKTGVLKGGGGAIGVRRRLTIGPEGRRERTELRLAGNLLDVSGTVIARTTSEEWSRLRLFPAGEFARFVSGELATAEPGEDGAWIARPTTSRTAFDLPFSVAVEAELRGSGQRVGDPFVVPGGDAVPNGVRVYVAEAEEEDASPTEFMLVGTGSGGYRPERVYVDLPNGWGCAASGVDSRCTPLDESQNDERTLWQCEGVAIAASTRGDHYLIRTGQKGEQRDRLILVGETPSGCVNAESHVPMYIGVPRLQLRDGRRDRAPTSGEVWWRPKEDQRWRPNPANALPGCCEFAWRDVDTGHIRDRSDAVVLPEGFRIDRRLIGDWLELSIVAWPGRLAIDGQSRGQSSAWRFPLKASSRSSCTARLQDGSGGEVALIVRLPHQAWIDDWSRGPVARNDRISLSTINRYVARTEGRPSCLAAMCLARRLLVVCRIEYRIAHPGVYRRLAPARAPLGEFDLLGKRAEFDFTIQRRSAEPGAV